MLWVGCSAPAAPPPLDLGFADCVGGGGAYSERGGGGGPPAVERGAASSKTSLVFLHRGHRTGKLHGKLDSRQAAPTCLLTRSSRASGSNNRPSRRLPACHIPLMCSTSPHGRTCPSLPARVPADCAGRGTPSCAAGQLRRSRSSDMACSRISKALRRGPGCARARGSRQLSPPRRFASG